MCGENAHVSSKTGRKWTWRGRWRDGRCSVGATFSDGCGRRPLSLGDGGPLGPTVNPAPAQAQPISSERWSKLSSLLRQMVGFLSNPSEGGKVFPKSESERATFFIHLLSTFLSLIFLFSIQSVQLPSWSGSPGASRSPGANQSGFREEAGLEAVTGQRRDNPSTLTITPHRVHVCLAGWFSISFFFASLCS